MADKYTGKEVIKAGEVLIDTDAPSKNEPEFEKAFDILSYWRFTHESPLETAFLTLQEITLQKDKNAIFAKRLKRFVSIVRKLRRFPDMKLKNMQDIGGCRAIVSNTKKVFQVVKELKKRPEFKSGDGKIRFKDYINTPKEDGYRGYHLVGRFDANDDKRNIELQVRTKLQHDWATTLEIVDLFTGQALKSNQGEKDWREFFLNISEQFAMMDESHLFDTLNQRDQYDYYQNKLLNANLERLNSFEETKLYAEKLDVVTLLQAYANSLRVVESRMGKELIEGYALIEVDTQAKTVTASIYNVQDTQTAEKRYAEAEKKATTQECLVVALVSTTKVGGIREAYPNYFADSTDFVIYLLLILSIKIPVRDVDSKVPEMFRRWFRGS